MKEKSSASKSDKIERFSICSYGVNIDIEVPRQQIGSAEIRQWLERIFPNGYEEHFSGNSEHRFGLCLNKDSVFELYKNSEKEAAARKKEDIFEMFESRLRLTVAEYAVGKVFLHAGVIGWKGKALVLPGKSYHGKTTLVAELVKKGAQYFSDEYAVLDELGQVHPFPKMLSIRGIIDDFRQVDFPVESFGGRAGKNALPVGMVLLTEYEKNAVWEPEVLSAGQGILEIISHTIPIRYKPEFALKVLNKIANRAIITKSHRGEANEFADVILKFFEEKTIENLF